MPKLYGSLAHWWPLVAPPADYAEAAAEYRALLEAGCEGHTQPTLLELGSGGGGNAFHLKARFRMTLTDLSPEMLGESEKLNPECQHIAGDMRTLRLGRVFDRVFVQDAIGFMTTADDLRRAIDTAFVHCRPGGLAVFAPDYVRETLRSGTGHGGHDAPDRSLRYLEWTWDPDPSDSQYVVDLVYALKDSAGAITAEHDRHTLGVFSRDEWMRQLRAAGFVPTVTTWRPADSDRPLDVFVGVRPSALDGA